MNERENPTPSASREPAMMLFAGIAILLLSFFVVMTHSANLEAKKVERVTRAVMTRFDPLAKSTNRFVSELGDSPGEQSMIGRIGKLVATSFPLAEVKIVEPGRVLLVDLPLGHMWVENQVAPTDSGGRFIVALAKRLSEPQARRLYGVEAWLIAAPDLPRPLALARIAAFGDAMEQAGAPSEAVATGVGTGPASRLRLVFRVRETGDG